MQIEPLEPRLLYSVTPIGNDIGGTTEIDEQEAVNTVPQHIDVTDTGVSSSTISDIPGETARRSPAAPLEISDQRGYADDPNPLDGNLPAHSDDVHQNLVFVDSSIKDLQTLLDDIRSRNSENVSWEIIQIDSNTDGIDVIGDTLAGRSHVDSVHFLTHGDKHGFQLGAIKLDINSIDQYRSDLEQWGHSLAAGADLLIYGCDLASTEDGLAVIDEISKATGGDVAASADTTGHESSDGNWELEYEVGDIETPVVVSQSAQDAWQGSLLLNTSPTSISSGIELNIDGADDAYLVSNDGGAIFGGLTSFTFETTFFHFPINDVFLASYATSTYDNTFVLRVEPSGDLIVDINVSTAVFTDIDYYDLLTDNKKHSVAVTWDSSNGDVYLYIDGESRGSKTGIATTGSLFGGPGNGAFVIGQEQDAVLGGFDSTQTTYGIIYDARVWDHVRTPVEIALNHQHKIDSNSQLPNGLIANWQMDGFNASNEVVDIVNGNNLSVGHATGAGYYHTNTPVTDLHLFEGSYSYPAFIGYVVPTDPDTTDDIVLDGSFRQQPIAAQFQTFTNPTSFGAWDVINHEAVVYNSDSEFAWTPNGNRPVELGNNGGPGKIQQTLNTVPGQTYELTFALAGDFSFGELTKDIRVRTGINTVDFSVTEPNGWTQQTPIWDSKSVTFTATGTTTNLAFVSLDTTGSGHSVVGDIQVVEVNDAINAVLNNNPGVTYNPGSGKFYKFISATATLSGAQTNAANELLNGVAGRLVTIDNDSENQFVANMVGAQGAWLGASDAAAEGEWRWLHNNKQFSNAAGDPVNGSFVSWNTSEPNNSGGTEHAGEIFPDGMWNDANENSPESSIVEWDANDVLTSYTFALTNDANGRFAIDSSTGGINVVTGSVLDYEVNASHQVTVEVTDPGGNTYSQLVTINVDDIDGRTDNYATDEQTLLNVNAAMGLLANDGTPGNAVAGSVVLGFDASTDTDGNNQWSSYIGASPLTIGPGISHLVPPTNPPAGIDAAFKLTGAGGLTSPALDSLPEIDGSQSATLETWVRFDNPTGTEIIFETGDNGSGGFTLLKQGTTLKLNLEEGISSQTASMVGALTPGTWQHVAVTIDMTGTPTIKVRVDGVMQLDIGFGALTNWASGAFGLGTANSNVAGSDIGNMQGEISHFKVHDRVLNGAQISSRSTQAFVASHDISLTAGTVVSINSNGSFTYDPAGQFESLGAGQTTTDTFSYTYDDGSGGQETVPVFITIQGVNDAPVLDASSAMTFNPVSEDSSNNPGQTVASLIASAGGDRITDVDSDPEGIAISGASNLNGNWEYSVGGGPWIGFPAVSVINALLLDETAEIRFEPNPGYNGTETITFRAWDQTTGTSGGTGSMASYGGTTAYSIAQTQASIVITAVNDPPVVDLDANNSTATGINYQGTFIPGLGSVAIADADSLITDPDNTTLQSLEVKITNTPDGVAESLSLTLPNGTWAAPYIAANSTLTIVPGPGSTHADWQTVIESIQYNNSSATPNTSNRTITFEADDGTDYNSPLATSLILYGTNQSPVLGSTSLFPLNVTENNGPVGTDLNLTVSDSDSPTLSSATVSISSNYVATEDILYFTDQSGINGSWDSVAGVLTLSGTASVADYQNALRTVTIENTSESPDTTSRTLSWSVNDGISDSNTLTRTVNINAVNDAPVFTQLPGNQGDTVDGSVSGATSTTAADLDGDGNLDLVTTTSTGAIIAYQGDGTGAFDSGTVITNSLDTPREVSAADLDNDGDLDLIAADYTTSQDNLIIYTNDGNGNFTSSVLEPGTGGVVQVDTGDLDGDGDIDIAANFWFSSEVVWYENIGGGVFDRNVVGSAAGGTSIDIGDVNGDGQNDIVSTFRNTNSVIYYQNDGSASSFTANNYTVSQAYDAVITDADNDGDSDIAYVGLGGVIGWLENDGATNPSFSDNQFGTAFGKAISISASDIDNDGDIDLLTSIDHTINYTSIYEDSFVIFENDGSGGFLPKIFNSAFGPSRIIAQDLNGDGNPEVITSDSNLSDVQVFNNLGSGGFAQAVTYEEVPVTLDPIVISDVDANSSLVNVTVSATNGSVSLTTSSGVTFTQSFSGTIADINSALANLTFTPQPDFNGDATIQITIDDLGNTGSGGAKTVQETLYVTVLPVNDAPNGTDNTITVIEDGSHTFSPSEFGFSDPVESDGFLSVFVTTLPSNGTLTLNGSTVTANQEILNSNIGNLIYTPNANFAGTGADWLSFQVRDTGGTQDSGIDTDPTRNTITFDITNVNDAPALSSIEALPAQFNENGLPVGLTGNINVNDVDDTNIESATVSITGNYIAGEDTLNFATQNGISGSFDSTTGVLSLAGSATLAQYQAALRTISYDNTSANPSTQNRTVTFVVNDGDVNSTPLSRIIQITPFNDAPTLSGIELLPAQFVENGTPVGLTGTLAVSDVDDVNIESAEVQISGNFVSTEDVLNFTTQNGITGSFDSTTGILSLTGSATLAQYQTALQSVSYDNTSNNPSILTRTVTVIINDGDLDSNTQSRDIEIVPLNDSPILSGIESTSTTYVETWAPISITNTLAVNDLDDVDIESASVQIITNYTATEDQLAFISQAGITGGYDSSTGILSLTGTASVADYEAVLRSVTYENTSSNPSTLTRTLEFTVHDGDALSNIALRDISIVPLNTAPVITGIETTSINYSENSVPVALTSNITLTDPDDTQIQQARVRISANYVSGEDTLNFTGQFGINGVFNSTTGALLLSGSATLADYEQAIRSITYTNSSDNPSTLQRTVEFSVSDGVSLSNKSYRAISIAPVNDAPVIIGTETTPVNYTENAVPVNLTNTISFTDLDDTQIQSGSVVISANYIPGEDSLIFNNQSGISGAFDGFTGTLTLSGSATLADYEQAFQSVTYVNSSNNPVTLQRTVDFTVNDGVDGSNASTRTISITPINDAPVLMGIESTANLYIENDPAIVVSNTISLSDIDDSNMESAEIEITGNFENGVDQLNFSGSATVAQYEIALRSVTYQAIGDNPDSQPRTISFTVHDGDVNSNALSRVINVSTFNDAPVLSSIEALPAQFNENGLPVGITGNLNVNDIDDTNIESAEVQISGNFISNEDVLGFTAQNGITGSFNATTGTLSLTGSATVAQYQAVLRTVTYDNTSDDPSTLTRTISLTVNDGDTDSNVRTRDIEITPVNDAPQLANLETTPAGYTEGGLPVAVSGTITTSDIDDINMESAIVEITGNFAAGEDNLNFTTQNGITGIYDQVTGELSLNGSATLADYQTALRSVTYENTSSNPSTLTRTVSFSINDGDVDSNQLNRAISFTASNDAPVLSAIESTQLNYTENSPAGIITGTMLVNDVDDTTIESARVAITGNYLAGEDQLNFTSQNGIAGTFDTATGILSLNGSATLAEYQTALRSVAYENTSDNPSTLARTVSFTINDGDADSNIQDRVIDITAINDAPLLSTIEAAPAYFIEDSAGVGLTGNIATSDLDDTHVESASVAISGNFITGEDVLNFTSQNGINGAFDNNSGILSLTGTATLAQYQAAIRTIEYNNTSDDPSTLIRTVSIMINDGDDDSTPLTREIEIIPVNDAPVLSSIEALPAQFNEDGLPVGLTGNIAVNDIDDTNIESATVSITGNFVTGEDVLSFSSQNGISGSFDQATGIMSLTGSATLAQYQNALQGVAYDNTSDNPSALTRTVSFVVNDGDNDSNPLSRAIEINPVNDAPVLSSIEALSAQFNENGSPVGLTGNIAVNDIDDTNIESATVSISGNFISGEDILNFNSQNGINGSFDQATGILSLTGSATLAEYQTALQTVTYDNTSDNPSTLTRTVSFIINDGDTDSNQLSRDIEITPVNDAPVLSSIETAPLNFPENSAPVAITNTVQVGDIDDSNIESAQIAISSNFVSGEDQLNFIDQNGITGVFDAANGVLSLNGSASVAQYQAALQSITYQAPGDNPTAQQRAISFTIDDGDATSNTLTRVIDITPVNDAPLLTTIESAPAIYIENSPGINITGNLSVSDADDTNLEFAVITITGNHNAAEDSLLFVDQSGITGSYDPIAGVLTLTGSATAAAYQTAIHSVTYVNSSDNPSLLTRTVSFMLNDGAADSNLLTRDINIMPVNDAPALNGIENTTTTYAESTAPITVTGTLGVSDLDDLFIESAEARISSNYIATEDQLLFTDQAGITGSFDSATGTLTLTGTASVADYETALQSVTYVNTSNNPSTLTRTVEFTADDGDSISNLVSRAISVTPLNNAPVITGIETTPVNYLENSPPIQLTNTIALTDPDDTQIQSATVAVSSNYTASEDTLVFSNQSGITGTFDSTTGVLTLTGSATLADYEQALQSVGYSNSSNNPVTLQRSVDITINDGVNAGNTVTRAISVTPVNDAPVVDNTETTSLQYAENSAPITITSTITIDDPDDSQIESAQIVIGSNFSAGEDILGFSDQNGIVGNYNPFTGVLQLTGTATVSDYEAALQAVTFEHTGDNTANLTRTIIYVVNDGDDSSNVATRSVAISPINDNPVLLSSDTGAVVFVENQLPVMITQTLSIADADDSSLQSATVAISTGYTAGEDVLAASSTPNINAAFDSATGVLQLSGNATLAEYETALRSVTYNNSSENPQTQPRTIEYQVYDSASVSNAITRPLTVVTVNDAPSGEDKITSIPEDSSYTISVADFGFTDPLDSHQFAGVQIQTVPVLGALQLNGNNVTTGQFISAADIALGGLIFTPAANENGNPYDSFDFLVVDDGDTSSNGMNTAQSDNSFEFIVIPVSDEPGGENTILVTAEDTPYIFTRADFGYTDIADNDLFSAVTITTLPVSGLLTLNNAPVPTGSVVDIADIDAGLLSFTPPQNATGAGFNGFTFQVHDDGTTTNGGITIDQSPNQISFDIPAVNDAPVLITTGETVDEGSDATINTDVLTATDADDTQLLFTINSLPVNGTLILNGIPAQAGDTLTLQQLQQDKLRYLHNGSETSTDFFDIQVSDGGEDGALPSIGRFTLTINEVVDPPPAVVDESVDLEFGQAFDSSDGDLLNSGNVLLSENTLTENPAFTISIETEPSHGVVALNPDGTFSYMHDGSLYMQDSFQYRITNEDGVSAVATVNISVEPPLGNATDQLLPYAAPTLETETDAPDEEDTSEHVVETGNPAFESVAIPEPSTSSTSEANEKLEVIAIQNNIDQLTPLISAPDGRLADLGVKQHNQTNYTKLSDDKVTISTAGIELLADLKVDRQHESINNRQFLDGLLQIDRDLAASDEVSKRRYELATETTIGISLGTTAGVIAWALRGGALFASVMAATPLWASIDPIRLTNKQAQSEKNSQAESEVEDYFD